MNNWLWTVLKLYIIHRRCYIFDTNILTSFMISLFLVTPAPRVRRTRSLMETSVRNRLRFFLLFEKSYFIQKLSFLINNLFGNIFQTPVLKKYLNSWKKYFLVWHFIENQIFIVSALFSGFSVFYIFNLMQLVYLVTEW